MVTVVASRVWLGLVCPGIPMLVSSFLVVPWLHSVRLLRRFPTIPDCVFVALIPWVPAGLVMVLVMLALLR
jgi:hypothetical protein